MCPGSGWLVWSPRRVKSEGILGLLGRAGRAGCGEVAGRAAGWRPAGGIDKKIAEGKTPKEALRALKRQISDAIYKHLKADAARAAAAGAQGPGGQPGNDSVASAAGSHPERRLFGQATPGPVTTLRRPADQQKRASSRTRKKTARTT